MHQCPQGSFVPITQPMDLMDYPPEFTPPEFPAEPLS